jgi:Amt family ammonium transporter
VEVTKLTDDTNEAFPIHGTCGAFGLLATAIFHTEKGIIYGHSAKILGIQLLGTVCIIVWNLLANFILLMPIRIIT